MGLSYRPYVSQPVHGRQHRPTSSATPKAKSTVRGPCSPSSGMKLYKEAEPIQFGAVERTQGIPMMRPEEPEDHLYMFVCYHHFLKLVSC